MERDDIGVKEEILERISEALNYPKDFFYQDNIICPSDTHYRKSISIDQKTLLRAEAIMNIYKFNVEELLKSLDLSTKNVPVLSEQYDSPEKVAKFIRSYWKIPKGSIDNLTKVAEDNGIIVIYIDFETDKIEGRTIIASTGHPIVFINKNSSSDRQRLTLSHEIAHVILHANNMPVMGRDEEEEAYKFAHEFLMPYSECQYDLNNKLTLEKLADLKRIWKVSMQAILERAKNQELITDSRYRYLQSQISNKGWKKREPLEPVKEMPTLLDKMVKIFIGELEHSKEEMAKIFKLNMGEFEERYMTKNYKLRIA